MKEEGLAVSWKAGSETHVPTAATRPNRMIRFRVTGAGSAGSTLQMNLGVPERSGGLERNTYKPGYSSSLANGPEFSFLNSVQALTALSADKYWARLG